MTKATTEPFRGVLILWSTGNDERNGAPLGLLATFRALQAFIGARLVAPCWILTHQAAKIFDDDLPVDPSQRCLFGLAAAVRQEHPELQCAVIDLPSRFDRVVEWNFAATIAQPGQESVVALRRDGVRGWRLRRRELPKEVWRPRGTVLVTGGLGGLGQQVARWLAKSGAEHLILASKTAPKHPAAPTLAAELRDLGVEVSLEAVDVSQREQLAELIDRLRGGAPALRSIFHLAAVTDDALLSDQTVESIEKAWGAKVSGACHLDSLTRDLPLDAFVLFSSLGSVLGNAGAANYSAANAGLDGIAEARRAAGLPAVAVNWGLWAGAGLGQAYLKAAGPQAMAPAKALATLQRLLASPPEQAAIVDIDWHGLERLGGGRHPALLSELVTIEGPSSDPALRSVREGAIGGLADDALGPLILTYLINHTAAILGGASEQLSERSNLFEYGMDSLMFVQLRNRLSTDFETAVFVNDIAGAPTLSQLVQLLLPISRNWAQRKTATRKDSARTPSKPKTSGASVRRVRLDAPQPPLFILSAPRSGSTLLRVMLAGHPSVFSPPELHLLPTETLAARDELIQATGLHHGLVRAVMAALNQGRTQAEATVEQWRAAGWTGREVYQKLNEATGLLVVDKSPTSASDPKYLARALRWCPEARFLHLARHPLAMMESFTRMRMHRVMPQTMDLDPWEVAERIWQACERNVRDFFAGLPEHQQFRIRYEDLVTAPELTLRELCDWLDLRYDPQMLDAYGPDRMTDSVAGEGSQIGDPNFHRRHTIDPVLADAWREVRAPRSLDPETIRLAEARGYVLAEGGDDEARAIGLSSGGSATPAEGAIPEEVTWELPEGPLVGLRWGAAEAPAVLCVHGHREQSLVWHAVATWLVGQGYQVIAPDLRGHGRSPHLLGAGGYPISVLLRDLAALMDRIPRLKIIVGHSLGGLLAQIVASASPKKLRGLVLVDVPTLRGRGIVPSGVDLEALIRPRTPVRAVFENPEAAAERLCKASPELDPGFARALAERILEPVENGWRWRWDARLELPFDGPAFDIHNAIDVDRLPPVAAIFGSRSPLTRPEDLGWVRAAGGRVMLVDAAHHPHLAHPEKVASLAAALDSEEEGPRGRFFERS